MLVDQKRKTTTKFTSFVHKFVTFICGEGIRDRSRSGFKPSKNPSILILF
jgi:hypothetical protein